MVILKVILYVQSSKVEESLTSELQAMRDQVGIDRLIDRSIDRRLINR